MELLFVAKLKWCLRATIILRVVEAAFAKVAIAFA
jgi:hypothetical protein